MATADIVTPGVRLCSTSEAAAGAGTYVRNEDVCASLLGLKTLESNGEGQVRQVFPRRCARGLPSFADLQLPTVHVIRKKTKTSAIVPAPGQVATAKVSVANTIRSTSWP